jgi:predicted CXXCH cytochrome family protein
MLQKGVAQIRRRLGLFVIAVSAAVLLCAAGARAQEERADPKASKDCTTAECHANQLSHKFVHGPARTDCGACHVQGNPDEHKFFLIVPREQLCAKCHALPHKNSSHAPVAQGRCLDCHDAHGSEQRKFLVADPKRELCAKCHKDTFTGNQFVHGPVVTGACVVCHNAHGSDKPHLLVQDGPALCQTCHPEVQTVAGPGRHVHPALEQGCTKCHDPHGSGFRYQLKAQAPDLCMTCHKEKFDSITQGAKVVHAAINQPGGCTKCHEPHSSGLPKLQRDAQPEICLSCHNKDLKTEAGVKSTLTNMSELLAQNPDHHGPIREGACTTCHNPHAGERFRMLAADYPPVFYAPFKPENFALCFKCHIPDLVVKASGQGLTNFRNGDKNLHFVHVNQAKGRTCRACHEVHASKRPFHIREAVPFGASGWELEINYQRNEDGGSCAPACHKPRQYSRSREASNPAIVTSTGAGK